MMIEVGVRPPRGDGCFASSLHTYRSYRISVGDLACMNRLIDGQGRGLERERADLTCPWKRSLQRPRESESQGGRV